MVPRPDRPRRLLDLIIWLPTFAGVAVLVAVLAFVGGRVLGASDEPTALLPPPVPPSAPSGPDLPAPLWPPTEPGASAGAVPVDRTRPAGPPAGPAQASTARPPAATRPPATRPPATALPAGPVTGSYRVLNSYDDAFIAEVLVSNAAGQASDWTVVLRFPGPVGELITSWVESAPQATLTSSGQTYRWRSGVPVPVGSSVPLRFHFARSGTGNLPTSCTVNGTPCTTRR